MLHLWGLILLDTRLYLIDLSAGLKGIIVKKAAISFLKDSLQSYPCLDVYTAVDNLGRAFYGFGKAQLI